MMEGKGDVLQHFSGAPKSECSVLRSCENLVRPFMPTYKGWTAVNVHTHHSTTATYLNQRLASTTKLRLAAASDMSMRSQVSRNLLKQWTTKEKFIVLVITLPVRFALSTDVRPFVSRNLLAGNLFRIAAPN